MVKRIIIYRMREEDYTRYTKSYEEMNLGSKPYCVACKPYKTAACGFELEVDDVVVAKDLHSRRRALYDPLCALEKRIVTKAQLTRKIKERDPHKWIKNAAERMPDLEFRIEMLQAANLL